MLIVNRINRRMFLGGLSGLAFPIPFLRSLAPREARAAGVDPLRFVAFASPFGVDYENWHKTTATPQERIAEQSWRMRLTDIPGPINAVLGAEWKHLYPKMTFIRGLDSASATSFHNYTHALGCAGAAAEKWLTPANANGTSVDQLLAEKIYTTEPRTRSVLFCDPLPFSTRGHAPTYSFTRGKSVPYLAEVGGVYEKLFSGVSLGSSPEDMARFEQAKQQDKLAVDHMLAGFQRVNQSRVISGGDKKLLSEFADRLRDLQSKIGQRQHSACQQPTVEKGTLSNSLSCTKNVDGDCVYTTSLSHNQVNRLLNDMMAAAFLCDLTRVVVISQTFVDPDIRVSRGRWHLEVGHKTGVASAIPLDLRYTRYRYGFIRELMEKLDGIKDASGATVLDNTLIMTSSEHGNAKRHSCVNFPVLVGGLAGGRIAGNQYLDYQRRPATGGTDYPLGRPFNNFFMDAMRCFGLTEKDWEVSGPGKGWGGYLRESVYRDYISREGINHRLPGFLKT